MEASDVDILKVRGMGRSSGSRRPLGVADLAMSETSGSSESDAESWGSDVLERSHHAAGPSEVALQGLQYTSCS